MIIDSYKEEDTFSFGEELGKKAVPGEIYALCGDLGVGKTVFTKGLAKGLGITESVCSPTFTIVQIYEEGRLPRIKGALMADAVATTAGAVMGTSTTTTFVESASGVTEGGRTGLTSMTTAILFLLSLLLSPVFLAIPSFATAPALIIVGFYMVNQVGLIDFSDYSEGIPAFICIGAMPFFYSISEGISMGVISYVVLNLVTGKAKEKKISPVMYILAVLFLAKYFLL